ncbi:hypothetical protein H8D30_02075 [bacterium]|nr:hypothetical protein [bacterium]
MNKGVWLLIDPTGPLAGLAIAQQEDVLASFVCSGKSLLERLSRGVKDLSEVLSVPSFEGVAVVVGPGSMMGGRIAVAWARGASKELLLKGVDAHQVLREWGGEEKGREHWTAQKIVRGRIALSRGGPPFLLSERDGVSRAQKHGPLWTGYLPPDLVKEPGRATLQEGSLPQFEAMWSVVKRSSPSAPQSLKPLFLD